MLLHYVLYNIYTIEKHMLDKWIEKAFNYLSYMLFDIYNWQKTYMKKKGSC
jgi:hypothetical protein